MMKRKGVIRILLALISLTVFLSAGCSLWPAAGTTGTVEESTTTGTTAVTTATTTAQATTASSAATTAATTTATTATTTAATTATTTATTATTTPTTTGVTENKLGVVLSATASGTRQITIDYVEMYFGAEAITKAKEDGSGVVETDESGVEYIPNDYYIRNNNPLIRTFALSDDCEIIMVDMESTPLADKAVTYDEFRAALAEYPRLMHVKVVNGVVIYMEEQYVP